MRATEDTALMGDAGPLCLLFAEFPRATFVLDFTRLGRGLSWNHLFWGSVYGKPLRGVKIFCSYLHTV